MGQRFQIVIKNGTDYYVYHNQWFYGGTAIAYTSHLLKELKSLRGNFRKALIEAGKGKNMFREGDQVKFYRYFSSANDDMISNDNREIASKQNWYAFLKTLDNNDGNLIVDAKTGEYCFFNTSGVDGAGDANIITDKCINATQYFGYYYSLKELENGRVISPYQMEKEKPGPITAEDREQAKEVKKILDFIDSQPMIHSLDDLPFPSVKVIKRKIPLRKDEKVTHKGIERPKKRLAGWNKD